jgi:hypothetical protein
MARTMPLVMSEIEAGRRTRKIFSSFVAPRLGAVSLISRGRLSRAPWVVLMI